MNAANYGVPQKRMRIFITGFRADIDAPFTFPAPTHSQDALLLSQWGTGEYWERHRVAQHQRPAAPDGIEKKVHSLQAKDPAQSLLPWETVRDAIADLPDPEARPDVELVQAHRFQPGARSYPGHTGSPLDEPAKALKAGDHGVPSGENMLRRPDGSIRYFTVRESARIQTFPDSFIYHAPAGQRGAGAVGVRGGGRRLRAPARGGRSTTDARNSISHPRRHAAQGSNSSPCG